MLKPPRLVWPVILSLLIARTASAAPLFGVPGTYGVDGSPVRVVAIDIDRHNGLDLVTGNQAGENGPSLSVLLNRGDGSFLPQAIVDLDGSRYILETIAAADFNGDGAGDVAVAVDDISVFPPQTVVLVYLNDGTGQLLGPDPYPLPAGVFPQCLEAGDVNGDGILDLVVCHSTASGGDGLISVLIGEATGGVANGMFVDAGDFQVGSLPATIAIGDIDADGYDDVVIGDSNVPGVFSLYGTGNSGLFQMPVSVASLSSPTAVRIRRRQGQPLPDLFVTSLAATELLIFHQTSPRDFASPTPIPVGQPPWDMGLGDFDGDGILDAVLLSFSGAQINLWYGTASGGFTAGESVPVDDMADSVAVADLNGDGKPDVATASLATDRVTVILNGVNAPTPVVTPSVTPAPPSPTRTRTPTRTKPPGTAATSTPTRTKPPGTAATSTPTPTPTGTATVTPTPAGPGDANCDGRINAADLNALIDRLFAPGCAAADVNEDGRVTASDLVQLLKLLGASH